MRTKVIKADTIHAAAERILDELKEDTTDTTRSISKRGNVIYFDGWDGLGATAVLRAVAQRLATASEAPIGLQFDQIIQIDCSKWESRRAMQRVIAKKLELPAVMMEMLNRQDEEDDYRRAEQGSRDEIPEIVAEIYKCIQNRRFLVIFYNGSSEEIDLTNFGFPLQDLAGVHLYSRNKVLWTFQGNFRLKSRMKIDRAMKITGTTGVFLSAALANEENGSHVLWRNLVHQEAAELVGSGIMEPALAAKCFLYILNLCGMGRHFTVDYDLATHGCNYWICDGIIQLQQLERDIASDDDWQAANALQREMRLDVDYYHHDHQGLPSQLAKCARFMPCWTSPTYRIVQILDEVVPTRDIWQHYNKLGVLKLSRCTFSFSSPPFLCCNNLRFLWLDHCQDQPFNRNGEGKEEDSHRCFQRLWVLDMRYTCCDQILSAHMMDLMTQLMELNVMGAQDWDMGQMKGRLPNIRKLRVTMSTIRCGSSSLENDLFSGMKKMELLDFSRNRITGRMKSLSIAATSNSSLETLRIDDGCIGLEQILFRGCAELKNVQLSGSFKELKSLDISGSAVKALDLSATTAQELDELVLLDCDKLCAIMWPSEDEFMQKLHIDTTEEGSISATAGSLPLVAKLGGRAGSIRATARSLSLVEKLGGRAPSEFNWYISVRDARLLRSIVPFKKYIHDKLLVHVEISPLTSRSAMNVGGTTVERIKSGIGSEQQVLVNLQETKQKPETRNALIYADAAASLKDQMQQASKGVDDGDASSIAQIWPFPSAPKLGRENCYMYIQDQPMGTKLPLGSGEVTSTTTIAIPDFICERARILHVHDSLSITSIPAANWHALMWCRVERCPKLGCLFDAPKSLAGKTKFYCLSTLWASQLLKARFIWNWNRSSVFDPQSCEDLTFLHVDFCPRLLHVLPFSMPMINNDQRLLETLEIMWCSDLRVVFPLEIDAEGHQDQHQQQAVTVEFPHLRWIHLHELPKLHSICGSRKMYAPNLRSIKIRGCWSLTRLPTVGGGTYRKKVECDCEKELWDRLKWDDYQHHSLYKPTHPQYYKKTLLRGSVLH